MSHSEPQTEPAGKPPAEPLALTESLLATQHDAPLLDTTIGQLLRAIAAEAPERLAVNGIATPQEPEPTRWTYAQLLAVSERLARRLLSDFQPGDHVAVWAVNKPEWVALQMGAALAGLVLVTLNPANRIEEMRYLLSKSAARGLFLDRAFRQMDNQAIMEQLRPGLPGLRTIIYFDQWQDYLDGPPSAQPLPQPRPDSVALILFTSGTTGKPKGAMLTQRGVVNNARFALQRFQLAPASVWLCTLPMFHVGGSVTNTLGCLVNRGTQVVMSEFNAGLMLSAIASHRANITMGVPIMAHAMLDHPEFDRTDLSSLALFLTGGTTLAPDFVQLVRDRFKTDVGVIFGQTEAGGCMCVSQRNDSAEHLCHTVGRPIDSYALKVIDTASGRVQPVNSVGEICVRSDCTMREYFDLSDKTAETLDSEGWLHTGDLGVLRADGYVQITGRLKDMIIRGGENIYPREIEDNLASHPAVAQVAVFGVPDARWGEQVGAALILKAGQQVQEEALAAFLVSRIARHKIPRHWYFVDAFPTNPSGKIQKFLLRDQLVPAAQAQ